MQANIRYPLGIQTFSKIIEDKLLYVDKTAIIYQLLQQGSVYFLSRPRRFGKSLLISTLESLFSGNKALFDGLAIVETDYNFAVYPVITLEFSAVNVDDADDLKQYIINAADDHAEHYGVTLCAQGWWQIDLSRNLCGYPIGINLYFMPIFIAG